MVTPPPRPSERAAIPAAMDQVIATGLAKQPADRYSTTVETVSAAKEAVTGTGASGVGPPPPSAPAAGVPAQSWPQQPWTQVGNTPAPYPASAPTQFSGPHHVQPPPPPRPSAPKKSSGRHGVLIGAAVFVVTLLVVGGVIGVHRAHPARQVHAPARRPPPPPVASTSAGRTRPTMGRARISMTSRCRMRLPRRAIGPSGRSAAPAAAWRRRRTSAAAARRCCRT